MTQLIFTRKNIASANIADALIAKFGFSASGKGEWTHAETRVKLLETNAPTVLDIPIGFNTDCLVVLSSHKSKNKGKLLSVHVPGNWGAAELGGDPKTLNTVPVREFKIFSQEIRREADLISWDFSLEADHHGPTCQAPIIFIEIGSDEAEWKDPVAVGAMANATVAALARLQNPKHETLEVALGFGGGHYPKEFSRLETQDTRLALSHICPKYEIDSLDPEMFKQAVEKNTEHVSKVLVLKDETNARQKEKVRQLADLFSLEVEMI